MELGLFERDVLSVPDVRRRQANRRCVPAVRGRQRAAHAAPHREPCPAMVARAARWRTASPQRCIRIEDADGLPRPAHFVYQWVLAKRLGTPLPLHSAVVLRWERPLSGTSLLIAPWAATRADRDRADLTRRLAESLAGPTAAAGRSSTKRWSSRPRIERESPEPTLA
jgi:hypothetical protein